VTVGEAVGILNHGEEVEWKGERHKKEGEKHSRN